MLEARAYKQEDRDAWDGIVDTAAKSHFLFRRGFMEYHSDRFTDASLMVFNDGEPVALLPANRIGDEVFSHQGLTFGGLVMAESFQSARNGLAAMDAVIDRLRADGIKSLTYKALPYIYSRRPAEEDLYALSRHGASLVRSDVTTSILLSNRGRIGSQRARGIKKAAKGGFVFKESADWAGYWNILSARLGQRHDAKPVHSLDEIMLLASRLPDHIRLFAATDSSGAILAGIVMFETATVAHAQYIAGTDDGLAAGALDGLFDHLIGHYTPLKTWFDFGISTEEGGRVLNEGLIAQKEGFGGSAAVHQVYRIML